MGSTQKVALLKEQLYERLGLDKLNKEVDPNSVAKRLENALAAWNAKDVGGAYSQLGPLIQNTSSLTDSQRADNAGL